MNNTYTPIYRQVKAAIRQPFAWPGGYPIAIVLRDGEAICPDCARKNWRSIVEAKMCPLGGWLPVAVTILWEGFNACVQCNGELSAYPPDNDCPDDPQEGANGAILTTATDFEP